MRLKYFLLSITWTATSLHDFTTFTTFTCRLQTTEMALFELVPDLE